MNNSRRLNAVQDLLAPRRLTKSEMDALYIEGEHYFRLSHIPKGQSDRAIYCVNFFLFASGHGRGFEEDRLCLLCDWFFKVRSVTTAAATAWWEKKLARAVYWKRKNASEAPLSDELIDRLMEMRKYAPKYFTRANLKRENEAKRKILDAIDVLELQGKRVSYKALRTLTSCSINTLRKHKELLSKGSGVITHVGVQGKSKKKGAVKNANCS